MTKAIGPVEAALNWVGTYELCDPEEGTATMMWAFDRYGIASKVKAAFPDEDPDLIDAYAMLRRMTNSRARARVS